MAINGGIAEFRRRVYYAVVDRKGQLQAVTDLSEVAVSYE